MVRGTAARVISKKESKRSILSRKMNEEQALVMKGARPGDRFLVEVKCVTEKQYDSEDMVLFLSKGADGTSAVERFFRVVGIEMAN